MRTQKYVGAVYTCAYKSSQVVIYMHVCTIYKHVQLCVFVYVYVDSRVRGVLAEYRSCKIESGLVCFLRVCCVSHG